MAVKSPSWGEKMKDDNKQREGSFTTAERRSLFLEMAGRPDGATASEVYRRAVQLGDTATEEAYFNLARRLVHRGIISSTSTDRGNRYRAKANTDQNWVEEDDLSALVDPDYPLVALTIWREARRQISEVPEWLWVELRERLRGQGARELFFRAIKSYCDDFNLQIRNLFDVEANRTPELSKLRQEAENSRQLLLRLAKYGLGVSKEAL